MKKIRKQHSGFTLIELIVSITIFMIIFLSVTTVFIASSDISRKSDINRSMQENMKNIVEIISEDIRKNGIIGVSTNILSSCNFDVNMGKFYKEGDKLCTGLNNYYLARKNISGNYIRTDVSSCENIKDSCVLFKHGSGPITNSLVSVKDLKFYASKDGTPKATITIVLQPSIKKGVKINLIKQSSMIFETTISEKPF